MFQASSLDTLISQLVLDGRDDFSHEVRLVAGKETELREGANAHCEDALHHRVLEVETLAQLGKDGGLILAGHGMRRPGQHRRHLESLGHRQLAAVNPDRVNGTQGAPQAQG